MEFKVSSENSSRSGIYSITNKLDGKRLIGSTTNFKRRFNSYKSSLKRGNYKSPYIQRAYKKHGTDSFIFESVCVCNICDLIELEDYFINAFDTMDSRFGYNLQLGSRTMFTEEMRKRISESLTGKKKSKNHCVNIGLARSGMKFTDEHRKNISKTHKGKGGRLGLNHTEESKKKMSISVQKYLDSDKFKNRDRSYLKKPRPYRVGIKYLKKK